MSISEILGATTLAVVMSSSVMAAELPDSQTMSFGYQYGHLKDYGDLHGGNFKFQYETASRWGVMGSLSAMRNIWQDEYSSCRKKNKMCREKYKEKHKFDRNAEYYSALIGPTYRISDKLSFFALGGISHTKVDNPLIYNIFDNTYMKDGTSSSNQFAYSTGLTFNATKNLAFSMAYEGSQTLFAPKKHDVKSTIINVGYRF